MPRQMIGAVEIADSNVFIVDIDAGDGAVVEQEPAFQSVGGVLPGQVKDGAHQMHEESAVADEGDMLFGLSLFVAVTGHQVRPDMFRAGLTFLFGLEGPVPPAVFIQRVGQVECGEVTFEERTRLAGQPLKFHIAVTPEDAAAFVDVPRLKRDLEPARGIRGGVHRPFHQGGIDARDTEAMLVLVIPMFRFGDLLIAFEIFCGALCLFDANLCEGRVGAFLVVWVAPAGIVGGLSMTDEVELHLMSLCDVVKIIAGKFSLP